MATRANNSGPDNGVCGDFTIYQRQGQTIIRPRHNKGGGKKRTLKTMSQRTKMGNLVSVWRAFGKRLSGTFEKQKPGSTDYTGFMSANERGSEVRLTKEEADFSMAIAGPYVVSYGQLTPSIEVAMEEEWMVSDILLGDNEIDEHTKVNFLSSELVYNNEGRLHFGDTLTFVRLTQRESRLRYKGMETLYRVEAQVHQLVLNPADSRPLGVALGLAEVADGWSARRGRLAAPRREKSFVAWIRSRKGTDGKVLAATQKLVGESDVYDRYRSWAQREKAIASYGQLEENFYKASVPLYDQKAYNQYVAEQKELPRQAQEQQRQEEEARRREQQQAEELAQQELERQKEEKELDQWIERMIEESTDPSNTVMEGPVSADCLPPEGGVVRIMPPDETDPDTYLIYAVPAEGWRFQCWNNGETRDELELPADEETHLVAFFARE